MSVFSQLLKYQFIVIHTVKGFGLVNKAEVFVGHNWSDLAAAAAAAADVYLELSCFFDDPADVGNLI